MMFYYLFVNIFVRNATEVQVGSGSIIQDLNTAYASRINKKPIAVVLLFSNTVPILIVSRRYGF